MVIRVNLLKSIKSHKGYLGGNVTFNFYEWVRFLNRFLVKKIYNRYRKFEYIFGHIIRFSL